MKSFIPLLLLIFPALVYSQKFLLGKYVREEPCCHCFIELTLFEKNKKTWFRLKTDKRNVVGKAKISKSEGFYWVTLPIKWAEYEGDVTDESKERVSLELPTQIEFQYSNKTLTMQNYGNAMNYYVVLGECGDKYIELKKLQKTFKK